MKNILVAIDFKESSRKLLAIAEELALKFYSKVWVVHIAAPEPEYIGYQVGPQYVRNNRAAELRSEHRIMEGYVKEMHKKHIAAQSLLIEGGTVKMIEQESERLGADLVIIGHHRHGTFYKAFVGCTDSEVVNRLKIPVLKVPVDN